MMEQAIPSHHFQGEPSSWDMDVEPESPGTRKLQYLATTQPRRDNAEVSAKLMERPISSGSTDLQNCAYGTAPTRDLRIPRKPTTAIYCAPAPELSANPENNKAARNGRFKTDIMGQHALTVTANIHDKAADNPQNASVDSIERSEASNVKSASTETRQSDNDTHTLSKPVNRPAPQQPSRSEPSGRLTSQERTGITPPLAQKERGFIVAPPSAADCDEQQGHSISWNSTDKYRDHDAPEQIATIHTPKTDHQNDLASKAQQLVIDTKLNGNEDLKRNKAIQDTVDEDNGSTTLASLTANGSSPGRRSRQLSPSAAEPCGLNNGRASSRLRAASQSMVAKVRPVSSRHRQLLSAADSVGTAATPPSEEDLYFLLLHRLRQRGQADKRSAARLHQLESDKSRLLGEVRGYEEQVDSFRGVESRQAAEIRYQKSTIEDMKQRFSKIKDFMKQVHEDRETLKVKVDAMNVDQKVLQDEGQDLKRILGEVTNVAQSSSGVVSALSSRLCGVRQETSILESSLHNSKFQLQQEKQLLVQERQRNLKLETHVAQVTRNQNNFSFTIQKEQQNLLNALNSIKGKLGNVETNQLVAQIPPNFPVLDQCLELLKGLCQVEIASSADIASVVQAVRVLSKNIDESREQSRESAQKAASASIDAGNVILSQATDQMNILVNKTGNKDEIADLREAKGTLEERLQVSEKMLMELRDSKAAAERREVDIRNNSEKVAEELTELRETILPPKKGGGTMVEIQNLLIKWTGANSLLAESLQRIEGKDQQIQAQEEQIRRLSVEAKEAQAAKENLVQENRVLTENLTTSEDSLPVEKTQMLAEQVHSGSKLDKELENSNHGTVLLRELEEARSVHERLARQLHETESRLHKEVQQANCSASTVTSLKQELVQMDNIRKENERLSAMDLDLVRKDKRIAELKKELESLEPIKQQAQLHQVNVESTKRECVDLKMKLQDTQKAAHELCTLQSEFDIVKKENTCLKDAKERCASLEVELEKKVDQMKELDSQVFRLSAAENELDGSIGQVTRWKDDYEVLQKRFDAVQQEAIRIPLLEEETAAKNAEMSTLRSKLVEAEEISKSVPKIRDQLHQFSETFKNLEHELEVARQAADEVQSTKAAKLCLEKEIDKLQRNLSLQKGYKVPAHSCDEDSSHDTLADDVFREISRRPDATLQKSRATVDSIDDQILPQGNDVLDGFDEQDLLQQSCFSKNDDAPDQKSTDSAISLSDSRKQRKQAVRDPGSMTTHEKLNRDTPSVQHDLQTSRSLSLMDTQSKLPESHDLSSQDHDDMSFVPESQPCATQHSKAPLREELTTFPVGYSISSSPLSDIGELFDSPEKSQSSANKPHGFREGANDAEARESTLAQDIPQYKVSQGLDTTRHKSYQEQRPPSSSYGESLLLDDLERLGSLRAADSLNVGSIKSSIRSNYENDAFLSHKHQSENGAKSQHVTPGITVSSESGAKGINATRRVHHLEAVPNGRRLRSGGTVSQTTTEQSFNTSLHSGDHAQRHATPCAPMKEKHQPNSAIKRRSDPAATTEETQAMDRKRAKRNLSNVEVIDRSTACSQTLQPPCIDGVGQSLSKLRQSSNPSAGSRMTIVGKNAPAPGAGKRGSKKSKGSRSQKYNQRFGARHG